MKTFRIIVLLLVAFLIPVRGAVAATMLCAGPNAEGQVAVEVPAHHAMHGDQAAPADHVDHHGDHAAPADQTNHAAHADHTMAAGSDVDHSGNGFHAGTCHLCATDCHAVPLVAAAPSMAGPSLTASVAFPAFKAPAPAFQSGGPERPPRTI